MAEFKVYYYFVSPVFTLLPRWNYRFECDMHTLFSSSMPFVFVHADGVKTRLSNAASNKTLCWSACDIDACLNVWYLNNLRNMSKRNTNLIRSLVYGMPRRQIADRGHGLQIRRVAGNIANKQSRTGGKMWPSCRVVGRGLTTIQL
jgi:hypothetical protein